MVLYALDHELFQAFSIYFFLPVILVQVDLNSKEYFSRSGLAFLDVFWQSLIWPCLYLVVNTLYLFSWSRLLIVDTSTSWRVFFSWLDVTKGFFFTMERILRSSTTVVLRGHPGLFMLLSSLVPSFFLRMYQTVDLATPNAPAISLMDLFWFWSPTIVCFTCMKSSFDRMMWVHNNSFQIQMAHLESTPDLWPA